MIKLRVRPTDSQTFPYLKKIRLFRILTPAFGFYYCQLGYAFLVRNLLISDLG